MILSKNIKLDVVEAAGAAGSTDLTSDSVDMAGFDGVLFIAHLGTLTAGQVTALRSQHSADDSTFGDIADGATGNAADGDGNKLLFVDVYRPQKRYVRVILDRATANAVLNGIIAIQYCGDKAPFTHADISQSVLVVGA